MTTNKIDCHKCKHYYITWDKNFPYGCRAINFKSRQLPSVAVLQNSGKPCFMFEPKEIKN